MNCTECTYAQQHLNWWLKIGKEEGLTTEEILVLFDENGCDCSKVGGKTSIFGHCSDYTPYIDNHAVSTQYENLRVKASKRRALTLRYKRKLLRQAKTITHYPNPCWMVDKNRKYTDSEAEMTHVKKAYKSAHANRYRYYKKVAAKAVRRLSLNISLKGSEYKKVFDYKWEID